MSGLELFFSIRQMATLRLGLGALLSNSTGFQNTASGAFALFSNTTGSDNTANGFSALYSNTAGFSNTAISFEPLYSNTTGSQNTAMGRRALGFIRPAPIIMQWV